MDQRNSPAASTPNSREGAAGLVRDDGEAVSIGALFAAAKATMAQHGPVAALPLWQEIRERFPHLPTGHLGYAEALKEAGRLDEAEGLLSESVKRFPDDPWAWIHYAQVATRRGDWTQALWRWQELRNRFPEGPAGYVGYAEALKEAGRLDEAEALLSVSVDRFPEDPWAWIHYAEVAVRRGDWTQALPRWKEVRNRFPEDPVGYIGYAGALKEAGRLDEAEGLLSESVHKFPDDPRAWIHYAQVATRRGDWTEALRRWQEVRNRFPTNPMSHVGIFEIFAFIRQYGTTLTLSLADAFEIQRRCLELLRLLGPNRVEGFRKARFGSAHDGGYIMIDDFDSVAAAFSFGIAQDANWDAAVADRGVPVYQFDHTIDASPISRRDLIFTKARIAAEPGQGGHTIDELVQRYGSPGQASLILKIDIEGDEWAVFDSASETALSCFTQIVAEFHYLGNAMVDPELYQQALRVFKKLTHRFGVVHIHANNGHGVNSVANVMVPHIVEITFANRLRYSLGVTDEIFPGQLDAPNDPGLPDIHLGRFMY